MRPDISNDISGGNLNERIEFPKCNVFQVHHPKYFIFWDRRINVILYLEHVWYPIPSVFLNKPLQPVIREGKREAMLCHLQFFREKEEDDPRNFS